MTGPFSPSWGKVISTGSEATSQHQPISCVTSPHIASPSTSLGLIVGGSDKQAMERIVYLYYQA